ncbi:RNA-binding region-containing protein 3 [Venturia canescens]|uniref:RNA-binding region-containing protein 3 n=1 Tax=Venturia canescens TaxID=32260 RepID=UPI001C9C6553|nr:RNA-binding region-containing protein 3 [Venturia canescens]
MVSDTLRVLHLPPHLSDERRDELFKKYGATKTRTVRRSDTYSSTFVKFPSKEAATEAFLQLHQLEIKGQYLSVEFAKKSLSEETPESETENKSLENEQKAEDKESSDGKHFQAFLKKLNGWTSNEIFTQPPHPNVWYRYSLPTKNTLLRIAIQLIKEPAFYTQVLHLMNKMNLPPPFEELEEEFPMLKEAYEIEKYRDILGRVGDDRNDRISAEEDEEESEIESDGGCNANPLANIAPKRSKPQSKKRLKIPKFTNPNKVKQSVTSTSTTSKIIRPEDMFESVQLPENKSKKIELKPIEKLDAEVRFPEKEENKSDEVEGGFGLIFPTKKNEGNAEDIECETTDKDIERDCITTEELEANKISSNDQRLLPVFKNYHAGKPSCRLYIKNLSKQVESKDLHFIYRRYVNERLDNSESPYDVRLMQEGRMKGQAFVTLQNIGQAQLALNETNGYILKDKPMVVQFAKAAKS